MHNLLCMFNFGGQYCDKIFPLYRRGQSRVYATPVVSLTSGKASRPPKRRRQRNRK